MKIAIQGHPTRGKEVIQILESLGGKKLYHPNADDTRLVFFINDKGYITCLHCENPILKECYKIYTLTEFEKEFPFKIGDKVVCKATQQILHTIVGISLDSFACMQYEIKEDKTGIITHCPTNLLIKYKEMKEERNITLTLDKAREWYQKGGELKEIALQAFTKEELNPLPESWEEYCKMYSSQAAQSIFIMGHPKKYIALWKLEQLRDCYRQGWKPDWANVNTNKYGIVLNSDKLSISLRGIGVKFLAFQSREVAEEFLKNFEPLIKEAGDLI